ncbi:hypothetical protein BH11PSE7_BH11PSE7_37780 [soil metagenome]
MCRLIALLRESSSAADCNWGVLQSARSSLTISLGFKFSNLNVWDASCSSRDAITCSRSSSFGRYWVSTIEFMSARSFLWNADGTYAAARTGAPARGRTGAALSGACRTAPASRSLACTPAWADADGAGFTRMGAGRTGACGLGNPAASVGCGNADACDGGSPIERGSGKRLGGASANVSGLSGATRRGSGRVGPFITGIGPRALMIASSVLRLASGWLRGGNGLSGVATAGFPLASWIGVPSVLSSGLCGACRTGASLRGGRFRFMFTLEGDVILPAYSVWSYCSAPATQTAHTRYSHLRAKDLQTM